MLLFVCLYLYVHQGHTNKFRMNEFVIFVVHKKNQFTILHISILCNGSTYIWTVSSKIISPKSSISVKHQIKPIVVHQYYPFYWDEKSWEFEWASCTTVVPKKFSIDNLRKFDSQNDICIYILFIQKAS